MDDDTANPAQGPSERRPLTVTKLEAAVRQLRTAIALYFSHGDEVSAHALAHAAYEVIHFVSRPHRTRDLIFDSDWIKDEYRREWVSAVKKAPNFFKHADRDPDPDTPIELHPIATEMFLMFAIAGLESMKFPMGDAEAAFVWWIQIQRPDMLTDKGREELAKIPIANIDFARRLSRQEYFLAYMEVRRIARAKGQID